MDAKLPVWQKLTPLKDKAAVAGSSTDGGLRELREDGTVPDSEMSKRGFGVDVKVVRRDDKDQKNVCTIVRLNPYAKTVVLQKEADDLLF